MNKFLFKPSQLPVYQCCQNTIGPLITFDLSLLNNIIINSNTIFTLEEENGDFNYIIEPVPFNQEIGLLIRSLIIDNVTNYLS